MVIHMNMAKPIIVLTAICVISSALLGMTYNVTKDKIEEVKAEASAAAMREVLPQAQDFKELAADPENGVLLAAEGSDNTGYVFKTQDKGYGGAFVVMVGIGADGNITDVKLLDNAETPGLGSKTGMPKFTDQFKGKDQSLEGVETITGATISSKAFLRCVDTAYKAYEKLGGGV